jgi:type II secretory pathway pseudopilin PulG
LREPSPTPHAKSAKASLQERFSKFPFLKFRIPHFAFPNQITPSHPWRPLRESYAFSLTEVVIAMGVAAVAFTSIIALFPLGLNMSKESYEETQAALLAQTIFSDFKDNLTGTNTTSSGFLLQIKATNSPENFSANYTNIPYGPSTHYVAYQQTNAGDTPNQETMLRPFDHSTSPDDFYTKGTSKALVIAKINLSYCFPLNSPTTGPNRVDITIETPGNLPTEKRKQLIFSGGFQ